jgi:hypothetical protein
MINTHKEFVKEILNFGDKMDFLNTTKYNTNLTNADKQLETLARRGMLFTLISSDLGDDYNYIFTYGFTVVDSVSDEVGTVVQAESENLFIVSALDDYLNHVLNSEIGITNINHSSIDSSNGVEIITSFQVEFTSKRSGSFWKKLEAFSV